jgi:hypothetical protein
VLILSSEQLRIFIETREIKEMPGGKKRKTGSEKAATAAAYTSRRAFT